MSYDAGTAFVQIVPSFQGVVTRIEEQASEWGDVAANAFKKVLGARTKDVQVGPSDESAGRQGESAGGKFADSFRARVDAALRALPSANVRLDDREAEAKLADIRARLETLRGVNVGVDLSDKDALGAIEVLKLELDRLKHDNPDVRVRVDAAAASAELAAVKVEADAASGESGGGGLAALASTAGDSMGEVSGLAIALVALVPALVPIAGLAAGALATLPAMLAGMGTGIGAVAIGFSGVTGAIQAYMADEKKAGAVTTNTAAAQRTAAQQALSNAQSERSAAVAVTSAQENLANARVQAIDRVHSAAESLAGAERSLQQAEWSEAQAQQALVQARRTAADQLTNLKDQVATGALSIRTAQFQVADALAALNAAKTTPAVTATQLARDTLVYQQAKQHLKDLTDQQAQLVTKQQQAQAAGITGSQQVQSAQHQVQLAVQGVATAQQALADKQHAYAEAQVQATQSIADAERRLTTALQHQADVFQQIALSAGGSSGSAASSMSTFQGAMSQLSPAAQQFVTFFTSTVLPMFDSFRGTVQAAFLPGIEGALTALKPALQAIEPFITQAATGIAQTFDEFAKWLSSKRGMKDLNELLAAGNAFFTKMGGIMTHVLIPAFATIAVQSIPILRGMTKEAAKLAHVFAHWVNDGGFTHFVHWLMKNGPTVVTELLDLVGASLKLVVALAPIGLQLLKLLPLIAALVDWMTSSWTHMVLVLGVLGAVAIALSMLLDPVNLIIVGIMALVLAGTELYAHWSTVWHGILTVARIVWAWIDSNVVGPIVGFFTHTIPNAIDTAVSFFQGLPGRIASAIGGVFGAITSGFGDVGHWVTAHVIAPVVGFFSGLGAGIGHVMSGVVTAITAPFRLSLDALRLIWNHTIGAVSFTIPSWVPGIGGDHFGVPKIPKLGKGGPVMPGEPYIVGDMGPELFVPSLPGVIVPNRTLVDGAFARPKAAGMLGAADLAKLADIVASRPAVVKLDGKVLATSVQSYGNWRRQHGDPQW